jgi:hypothetical protein
MVPHGGGEQSAGDRTPPYIDWRGLWVLGLGALLVLVGFGPAFYDAYKANQILKHGKPAQAKVVDARPTGNLHNDQPEVRFKLEVFPEGDEAFTAIITTIMSPVYLPRFQPGQLVQVRYLPESRRDVAFVPP